MTAKRKRRTSWLTKVLVLLAVLAIVLILVAGILGPRKAQAAGIPRAAEQHRRDLVRYARYVWGLNAPVATFAAQVHQESGWRPDARSVCAAGLAQFTEPTARDMARMYPAELGEAAPLNPRWALRALVRYDRRIWEGMAAASACDRWAFVLAAYNGGPGWINRDRALAERHGAAPARWWGEVERFSSRSAQAFKENRGYPRRILLVLQPLYVKAGWGPGVACMEGR